MVKSILSIVFPGSTQIQKLLKLAHGSRDEQKQQPQRRGDGRQGLVQLAQQDGRTGLHPGVESLQVAGSLHY